MRNLKLFLSTLSLLVAALSGLDAAVMPNLRGISVDSARTLFKTDTTLKFVVLQDSFYTDSITPGVVAWQYPLPDSAVQDTIKVKPAAPYRFDEIRDGLYVVLQDRHLQQKLEELLLHVVKQYDITINRAALRQVKYLGGNLAVKKAHFPLRNAVPGFRLFDPKAKWYQEGVGKN